MKINIVCRLQVEGLHNWSSCSLSEVGYLKNYHRHVFHIIGYTKVCGDNRELEFIQLSHSIKEYLNDHYYDNTHRVLMFGGQSCEMLAKELLLNFGLDSCEVNEDGEGGALVER